MPEITLVLDCGAVEERHSWQLASSGAVVAGEWAPASLPGQTHISLANASARAGSWELTLSAETAWPEDVLAEIHIPLATAPMRLLWPLYQGVFERFGADQARSADFRGPGRTAGALPDERRLGLPLVVLESAGGSLLAGVDPAFSTTIAYAPARENYPELVLSWRWLARAGVHSREQRCFFLQPVFDLRAALDRWFELATPDIPAGPTWLQEIALNDYDYLSKNGEGWFRDIDAACEMILPAERHRALFCLHGWYDQVGRYCFDPATGKLDAGWIAFPHTNHPDLLKLEERAHGGSQVPAGYTFRNLRRYHPVQLTWDDMRARLRYAKDRGFRTAVYHATGLQAAGEAGPHIAAGTALESAIHLWTGPDLVGPTYLLNPLHPEVRNWMLRYTEALLNEVGSLADALVLDEAYYIGYGTLGPAACSGYADRAQATLVQEITRLCHSVRPDLAYLTADHLGTTMLEQRAYPYSLYADGIYHDAWCSPQSWECSRIPTWRNVTWSCNWAPVSNMANTRWGVLAYNAPIALSNGCFGDDIGLADMDRETADRLASLWRARAGRKWTRPLAVVDAIPTDL
jgi:hypothetical protein